VNAGRDAEIDDVPRVIPCAALFARCHRLHAPQMSRRIGSHWSQAHGLLQLVGKPYSSCTRPRCPAVPAFVLIRETITILIALLPWFRTFRY
jgi:hypothetical protein